MDNNAHEIIHLGNHAFRQRMVHAADMRFHVVEGGRGDPVVLMAGFPQSWYAWRRVMPLLAEHYRVTQSRASLLTQRPTIVQHAADLRLPVIYGFREDVDAGGLMSYGADIANMLENAVVYVDKILRGTKPADLPVQEARKLDLAINLKAAKALGLRSRPRSSPGQITSSSNYLERRRCPWRRVQS